MKKDNIESKEIVNKMFTVLKEETSNTKEIVKIVKEITVKIRSLQDHQLKQLEHIGALNEIIKVLLLFVIVISAAFIFICLILSKGWPILTFIQYIVGLYNKSSDDGRLSVLATVLTSALVVAPISYFIGKMRRK